MKTSFKKTTAAALCALTLFSTRVFAEDPQVSPVRETFENEGYTVTYNADSKSVTISKDSFSFTEEIGNNIFYLEGSNDNLTYAEPIFFANVYSLSAKYSEASIFETTGTVTEISDTYIEAETAQYGTVVFNIDESTRFRHEINRRIYTIEDVSVGDELSFYHAGAMTMSLPPQTYTYEVVFPAADENAAAAEAE
ncbi:MAG: copper amine oxidase N-terminal domain-containing protein [Clostridia bacterium]|nr:copper amine oxidase N-terminal domain-containing protein [Clostridia bacterium]